MMVEMLLRVMLIAVVVRLNGGFAFRQTNSQKDVGDCRVVFMTETHQILC